METNNPELELLRKQLWNMREDVAFLKEAAAKLASPHRIRAEIQAPVTAPGPFFAPPDATYLVTTADADLTAGVAVGATPGGELGGTWGSPTVDTTHSGSRHSPQQIITVAKAGGDYTTIQGAINAISDNAESKRYLIRIMPGKYTEQVTMKSYVDLRGMGSKHSVQLTYTGNNNGTIILADSVQIEDLLIEATTTGTEWAIVGSNTSNVHIRNVDILAATTSYVSQGIKITGNSWATLFIEHGVINYRGTTGNGINLTGNATTPQNIDTHLNDVFVDSYEATTGGSVYIADCTAGRMRDCLLRTSTAGYCLSINDTSAATTDWLLDSSTAEYGTSSVEVDTGATVLLKHSHVDSLSGGGTTRSFGSGLALEKFFTTGFVGIGTSSPDYNLDVEYAGNTWIVANALATSRAAQFRAIRNSLDTFIGPAAANEMHIWTEENIPIIFALNDAEKMRISTAGYVGIGSTDPDSPLHVVGLPQYADNAAAVTGGLAAGAFYLTGADPDPVCVVH